MNKLFEFYLGVKRILIQRNGNDIPEARKLLDNLPKIEKLSSWKPNVFKIERLCQVYADPTHSCTEERVCRFLLAAMKDLMTMKNPQAHSLFEELRTMLLGEEESDKWFFIWVRKTRVHGKSCRVMTVHTSGLLPKNLGELRMVVDDGLEGGVAASYDLL